MIIHLSADHLEQIAAIDGVGGGVQSRALRTLRGWRARLYSDLVGTFGDDTESLRSDADLDPWLRLNDYEVEALRKALAAAGRTDLIEALDAKDEVAPFGERTPQIPAPGDIVLAVMEAGIFTGRTGHDIEKVLAVSECLFAGMLRERMVEGMSVPIKVKVIAETLAGYGPARWREAVSQIVGDLAVLSENSLPARA